jgi:hypothetical protein
MSRFAECDTCGPPTGQVLECATTRPSDSTSLCCVLTACEGCATPDAPPGTPLPADRIPSIGTTEQFDQWVEEHGFKHGVYFYE